MILKNTWSCNILIEWELKHEDVKLAPTYQKPGEDNQGLKLSNNPHTLKWSCSVVSDSLRPVDCSLPGFSVRGILQARIPEWVAISFSRGSSQPRDRTQDSHTGGRRFNLWATREAKCSFSTLSDAPLVTQKVKNLPAKQEWSEVAQSCPTLCDPMDCSLPGSSVHGILQARILEWVTISFSRVSSRPSDQTQVCHIGGRRFNLWATREAVVI